MTDCRCCWLSSLRAAQSLRESREAHRLACFNSSLISRILWVGRIDARESNDLPGSCGTSLSTVKLPFSCSTSPYLAPSHLLYSLYSNHLPISSSRSSLPYRNHGRDPQARQAIRHTPQGIRKGIPRLPRYWTHGRHGFDPKIRHQHEATGLPRARPRYGLGEVQLRL